MPYVLFEQEMCGNLLVIALVLLVKGVEEMQKYFRLQFYNYEREKKLPIFHISSMIPL